LQRQFNFSSIDRVKAFYFWTTTLTRRPRLDVIKSSFRLLSDCVDEALRVARGWSEYDSAPRNGAEYRFRKYQKAREEQRCECQVSSSIGTTGIGPPIGVGSVDEGS